jgi:hypothetical protein
MPGISVSKMCIPFGAGGIDYLSYWTTLISATVETAAPTHVVLTFPAAQTGLVATDFTIAGFTISSASWTGAVLTLVLSEAVLVFDGDLTITFVTTGGTATVTNNVADDGNTVGWYDSTDLTTITKDGGNLVSQWNDKLLSGHDLIQVTGAKQPLWILNDGILFDADWMKTAPFVFNQPVMCYVVMQQITWVGGGQFFDGNTDYSLGATRFGLYCGAALAPDLNELELEEWGIVKFLGNGLTSKYQINEFPAVIGNAGSSAAGGITVGSKSDGSAAYGNIKVKYIIFRNNADNAGEEAAIYSSLRRKIQPDILLAISANAQSMANAYKVTITEAGDYNGMVYTMDNTSYPQCWIVDVWYSYKAGLISDAEMLNVYNWYKSHIDTVGVHAYWTPTCIEADGTVHLTPGLSDIYGVRSPVDSNAVMALIAAKYYAGTSDDVFISAELPFLEALLTTLPYDVNGLIYCDDGAAFEFVNYQYYDSVRFSGEFAMVNVALYDALNQLNNICIGLAETGYSFDNYAAAIKNSWVTTFWDGTMIKAATIKEVGQFDVLAGAYAISCGLVEGSNATAIATRIYNILGDIRYNGYLKYMPTAYYYAADAVWEAVFAIQDFGVFQNGGYVIAPNLVDIVKTIKLIDNNAAKKLVYDCCNYMWGLTDFIEWISSTDHGLHQYLPSAAAIKLAIDEI